MMYIIKDQVNFYFRPPQNHLNHALSQFPVVSMLNKLYRLLKILIAVFVNFYEVNAISDTARQNTIKIYVQAKKNLAHQMSI